MASQQTILILILYRSGDLIPLKPTDFSLGEVVDTPPLEATSI